MEKACFRVIRWLASDRTSVLNISSLNLTELPDNFPDDFNGKLDCSCNRLITLSLPMATTVSCYHNQLTTLSAPMATYAECSYNQLTMLSLPMAMFVHCYNNKLTSLSLPMANHVDCFNNQLIMLHMPKVKYLDMNNNPIEFRLACILKGAEYQKILTVCKACFQLLKLLKIRQTNALIKSECVSKQFKFILQTQLWRKPG